MKKILLIEDDALVAMAVEGQIRDAGHGVIWASSAWDAVAILEYGPHDFEALVTDIDLGPGPSGFDLADQARAGRPDLPVVYVTGRPEAQFLQRGVPGSALIRKPVRPFDVTQALGQVLAHRDACAA